MNPQKLRVHSGDIILPEHHNGLVSLAEEIQIGRGRLKGRQDPDGFLPRPVQRKPSTSVDHDFKVRTESGATDDDLLVTLTPGHVDGKIPTIAGLALDDVDASGDPPKLHVDGSAWRQKGRTERALIMLRYFLFHDTYAVDRVEVIAVPAPPTVMGFEWYKLVAILIRFEGSVRVSQQMFFSQYFDVSEAHNGTFRPWPRAGA